MKYLNLHIKTFSFLLISFFAFNSSARFGAPGLFDDVQKAAKEAGHDVDWKTCADNDGGFDPEHVRKVVATDNDSPCDPNDSLVKKYKNNFVTISGLSNKGGYFSGAGFLIEGCSKIVTAGHVFYEKDKNTKLKNFHVLTHSNGSLHKLGDSPSIKEGPWKSTGSYKDEVSFMEVPKLQKSCVGVSMIANTTDIRTVAVSGKMDFYILRADENGLCAQKCKILSSALNKASSLKDIEGSVEHDCQTWKGVSGSPVFAKSSDGEDYFVGIHTGANPYREKVNLFAPASSRQLSALGSSTPVSK